MDVRGRHIYGIINSGKDLFFGSCGAADGEEVYTIPYRDISAIVSDSEIADYTVLPKDAVARRLIRHQEVIEKIMENFAVIPVQVGTFVCDEDEVRYVLAKGHALFKDIFNKISGKIEIDIAATWSDFRSTLREIGEKKEIMEIKEGLSADPEAITVDDQMKIGVMVKKVLDKKREMWAGEIEDSLKTVSRDSRAHELMDDKMVINAAFLIDRVMRGDFEKKVEELNARFGEKLNFRCVGPLPPYSFYTLEVKKMRLKEVRWAKNKLRIVNDFSSRYEIQMVYRKLASFYHPDKNPDKKGIEKEFNEINKAYKILVDYCKACEQSGCGEGYSFSEEEFKKNAILVKVRE